MTGEFPIPLFLSTLGSISNSQVTVILTFTQCRAPYCCRVNGDISEAIHSEGAFTTTLHLTHRLPVSVGVNLPRSSPPHNGNRFVPPGIADQAAGPVDYSASIQAPDFKVDWD